MTQNIRYTTRTVGQKMVKKWPLLTQLRLIIKSYSVKIISYWRKEGWKNNNLQQFCFYLSFVRSYYDKLPRVNHQSKNLWLWTVRDISKRFLGLACVRLEIHNQKKNSCTSHLVYVMIQLLSFSFSVSTGSVVNRGGREGRKTWCFEFREQTEAKI